MIHIFHFLWSLRSPSFPHLMSSFVVFLFLSRSHFFRLGCLLSISFPRLPVRFIPVILYQEIIIRSSYDCPTPGTDSPTDDNNCFSCFRHIPTNLHCCSTFGMLLPLRIAGHFIIRRYSISQLINFELCVSY